MEKIDRQNLDVIFKYFLENPSKVCNDLVYKIKLYTVYESIDWSTPDNAQILRMGSEVFPGQDAFLLWLVEENHELSFTTPIEYLKRVKGTSVIFDLIVKQSGYRFE